MKTLVITANLENEIKDIRALEAKINELDELKKEKEALIKSVLDRTSCLYNHGFVISCKPLKETIANKNLAEDIEVKSTYIPAEQEKLSLADCIKNSVNLLKKKIGL